LNPRIVPLVLIAVGVTIVVIGVVYAFIAYNSYSNILPRASTLEQSITYTVYELLNLVIKLSFLGLGIWGGSIVLKHGVQSFIQLARREEDGKKGEEK